MATASSEKSSLVSAKELASKLKVTDALIKKLVKDFDLKSEKVKNRTHLPNESVETLKQIIQLKEEGKKPKEIKAILIPPEKEKKAEKEDKPDKEEKKAKAKKSPKKDFKSKKKFEKKKPKEEKPEDSEPDYKEYVKDEAAEHEHLELENKILTDLKDDIESELDDSEEEIEELEEVEESPSKSNQPNQFGRNRRVRRKKFNFRYVQRQIANDSKHIKYLQHRLRRTNISPLERVTLEENLDKRSRLLNGWLHILRWIKSN